MSLRFQRLILIIITLVFFCSAVLLILFNTQKNIVFFYTPSELIKNDKNLLEKKVRIGGYVKKNSFLQKPLNNYQFKITDNISELLVFYEGILPDLFKEGQGTVVEGVLNNKNIIIASKVYAKHDENYMPASIKKELEKNNQWKKDYK
ncbi:MAG: cytochrome c maturation protein CcmE [Pelagibacteraceae bacterium]|nr:cytochrome c maturation protein CcmE [Pelagibacteraceae bacterium]